MKSLWLVVALVFALGAGAWLVGCDSDCGDTDDAEACSSCCYPSGYDWDMELGCTCMD